MRVERILVAVDGSEHSDKAVELAGSLATSQDAAVTVLHVVQDVGTASVPPGLEEYAALENVFITERDLRMSAANSIVGRAAKRLSDMGVPDPHTDIAVGAPAHQIVEAAKRMGADMIVIGSRGLGGVGTLLGSTSHKVSQSASCTVVTVR